MKNLECGHVYGCRLSKNGKWLNLTIATKEDGEELRICVPICLEERDGKPNARIDEDGYAVIENLKVFKDEKPKAEEKKEEPEDPYDGPFDGAVPF